MTLGAAIIGGVGTLIEQSSGVNPLNTATLTLALIENMGLTLYEDPPNPDTIAAWANQKPGGGINPSQGTHGNQPMVTETGSAQFTTTRWLDAGDDADDFIDLDGWTIYWLGVVTGDSPSPSKAYNAVFLFGDAYSHIFSLAIFCDGDGQNRLFAVHYDTGVKLTPDISLMKDVLYLIRFRFDGSRVYIRIGGIEESVAAGNLYDQTGRGFAIGAMFANMRRGYFFDSHLDENTRVGIDAWLRRKQPDAMIGDGLDNDGIIDPKTVANRTLVLEPGVGITGNPITAWADQSGIALPNDFIQITEGYQPADVDGVPTFSGSQQYMYQGGSGFGSSIWAVDRGYVTYFVFTLLSNSPHATKDNGAPALIGMPLNPLISLGAIYYAGGQNLMFCQHYDEITGAQYTADIAIETGAQYLMRSRFDQQYLYLRIAGSEVQIATTKLHWSVAGVPAWLAAGGGTSRLNVAIQHVASISSHPLQTTLDGIDAFFQAQYPGITL